MTNITEFFVKDLGSISDFISAEIIGGKSGFKYIKVVDYTKNLRFYNLNYVISITGNEVE